MIAAPVVLAAVVLAPYDPAHLLTLGSQPTVDYSADCVMVTEAGRVPSKVWFSRGKERREMALGSGVTTVITRPDKKVVWTLVPEVRQYQETPITENVIRAPFAGEVPPFEIEQTYVDDEVVDGIPCRKTKVILTDRSNGAKLGGFFWTTRDGILLRAEAAAKSEGSAALFKLELTNVVIAPQPAELFEVPSGFTKTWVPPVQGVFRPTVPGRR
jgi:hypothetical protein